jgi:hypothetical protein
MREGYVNLAVANHDLFDEGFNDLPLEGWDKFQNVIKVRQLARWILSRRASSASGRIQTIRRNLMVYHSLVLMKHRGTTMVKNNGFDK